METIVCPPQRRSILIGWYDADPRVGDKPRKKGLFRLWFPEMTFVLGESNFFGTYFYVAFNFGFPVFPFLTNIYEDFHVCQKIDQGTSCSSEIYKFWASEFWDYSHYAGWRGSRLTFKLFGKGEANYLNSFNAYRAWSELSLQEVQEKMTDFVASNHYENLMSAARTPVFWR